jgi:surface carbohydrate biosynthesis protein (TIGR04326 family)
VKLLRNAKKDHEIFLVPHVPSKFWDLRSWYFPRIEHDIKICVSSGAAYKAYQGAGIDARRLIRIEAMRFNRESGGAVEQSKQLPPSAERSIKIAYFADYSSKVTSSHILLLIEALKKVKVNFELLIKNHPDSEADFSCLEFCKPRLVNEDAYAIIKDSNIVVAGARSSISVQGWEMGAYLLLIYDRTRLNSSAMRELDSITFCGDHNELTAGILQYSDVESPVDPFRNFFITDPALRRWRNLIGALDDRNMEIL